MLPNNRTSVIFIFAIFCALTHGFPSELNYQWPENSDIFFDGRHIRTIDSLTGESFGMAKRLELIRNQRKPQSKSRRIVNNCCDSLLPGGPFGKGKRSTDASSRTALKSSVEEVEKQIKTSRELSRPLRTPGLDSLGNESYGLKKKNTLNYLLLYPQLRDILKYLEQERELREDKYKAFNNEENIFY
ncbi:uncharacterized protein LOC108732657 isoform X2 [Agrilus planipennis]|uniref:Uncharacterized protein LOC108732657 isoform X2 n=1 Tax=Agrilus planipennis TaxID=224129 RepID=A0A1W4WG35_AGRPL|nr:uncharacterized protein LOC108732657 isoform X2 [Agrilus planipennis]